LPSTQPSVTHGSDVPSRTNNWATPLKVGATSRLPPPWGGHEPATVAGLGPGRDTTRMGPGAACGRHMTSRGCGRRR
jgi:hypothetical protein